MATDGPVDAAHDQGYVTSAAYSPILQSAIGLAFVKGGANRMGERLRLVNPLENQTVLVEIVSPHFVDPEGEKLRA
ncbi:glycine cleavage T C-terminal barrel domain-containing protein [Phaeobacter inhibens]